MPIISVVLEISEEIVRFNKNGRKGHAFYREYRETMP